MKIIDFGSTKVAGVIEGSPSIDRNDILGTVQYTAPEYLLGEGSSSRADFFSLGVITYQMLTGRLPYGAEMAKARTKSQQRKLAYKTALDRNRDIPAWIDGVLRKAVHADPYKRYEALSAYIFDLRNPNKIFLNASSIPLTERNPLIFWKSLCLILLCVIVALLAIKMRH